VIRFTTDPKLANSKVHLIDCKLPCFLYVSGNAFVQGSPEADTALQVLAASDRPSASSDRPSIKPLMEGQELEQTLSDGESQVFRYHIRRNDTAALFSVSRTVGGTSFQVSSSYDFPDDPEYTTQMADAIVLLEPSSKPFRAAVLEAADNPEKTPALYIRVVAKAGPPSTFAVSAKAEACRLAEMNYYWSKLMIDGITAMVMING
ncbi:unnamed protein product, partial [Polarella glacialis]